MQNDSMEGASQAPETIESEKETTISYGPNDSSPWGKFGEEYNGNSQEALENKWVEYNEELDRYVLTPEGKEITQRKRPPIAMAGAYKGMNKRGLAGWKPKERKPLKPSKLFGSR